MLTGRKERTSFWQEGGSGEGSYLLGAMPHPVSEVSPSPLSVNTGGPIGNIIEKLMTTLTDLCTSLDLGWDKFSFSEFLITEMI